MRTANALWFAMAAIANGVFYMAATKEDAFKAYDRFTQIYSAKYEKACQCLEKDRDARMCFYNLPAHHWKHICTTHPIESTFAPLRHRHRLTKGNGNRESTLAMVYKLAIEAEKHWRKISATQLLDKVVAGVCFVDGIQGQRKGGIDTLNGRVGIRISAQSTTFGYISILIFISLF